MQRFKLFRHLVLFIAIVVISGCVPQKAVRPPDPYNPIKVVAVLPLINNTNSVDGPQFVRKQLSERLPKYHYQVQPLKDVDIVLRDQMGVTLGSQLEMTTPQELGKVVRADALIYGTLMDFNTKITGFQNLKEVRAKFKMVNTKTGAVIWENGIGVRNEVKSGAVGDVMSTVDAIKQMTQQEEVPWVKIESRQEKDVGTALVGSLLEKVITQAVGAPLALEVGQALDIVLDGYYQQQGGLYGGPPPIPYGRPIP
ncbi:MAG TPA: hypothetical protein DD641_03315, partial [Deltaproteobacteria bacterium]|nr:hypothetical protein [Deltaproteobacteria bacterium]